MTARDATVGWGRTAVLSGVSFELRAGDFIGLVGPNGAGKSTLVRAVLGLAPPLAGTIVRAPTWRAGYVPQRESVEPLLRFRAEEVVAMAALTPRWAPFTAGARRRALARAALAAVGMETLARRVFRDLSGGQRQRVILARALACEPSALVLDEPTNGLDLAAERDIFRLVRQLLADRGLACILVTHDLDVVVGEVATVGLIHSGDVTFGAPHELLSEASLTSIYGDGVRLPPVDAERMR